VRKLNSESPSLGKRLMKGFRALAILAVGGLAALLGGLWLEHRTSVTLPVPTGSFAVGRTSYAWVNDAETDELAPDPQAKREVVAWIWYPAPSSTPIRADYLPADWRMAQERSSGILMGKLLTRIPQAVLTHSSIDPPVSMDQPTYPVVIMRAGGGALTTDFTTLAEDLASHGYFVVGFDAPYRSWFVVFPDGRVVVRSRLANPENFPAAEQDRLIERLLPMWSGDARFVVDQLDRLNTSDPRLAGRLDMRRLGFFGHSFGGATALQFCHDDFRCKAGIDIDGAPRGSVVKEGLTQPFLFLVSDHGAASSPEDRAILANIKSISNGRMPLTIRGANHFSFSDQMLVKSHLMIRLLQLFQGGGLEARRGLTITTAYVHTFFDVNLKNAPASLLDDLRKTYPEVQGLPQ
jgi:hypothetical protein